MVAYARKLGGDEERWAVTGLVHDLDYERHPDLDDTENGHPRTALRLFEELGWPQDVIDAVAGHATFLGVPRETRHGEGAVRRRRAVRVHRRLRARAPDRDRGHGAQVGARRS